MINSSGFPVSCRPSPCDRSADQREGDGLPQNARQGRRLEGTGADAHLGGAEQHLPHAHVPHGRQRRVQRHRRHSKPHRKGGSRCSFQVAVWRGLRFCFTCCCNGRFLRPREFDRFFAFDARSSPRRIFEARNLCGAVALLVSWRACRVVGARQELRGAFPQPLAACLLLSGTI